MKEQMYYTKGLLMYLKISSLVIISCVTPGRLKRTEIVSFRLNSLGCDWVEASMRVITEEDSGKLMFDLWSPTHGWLEYSSVASKLTKNRFVESKGLNSAEFKAGWLVGDSGSLYRACFLGAQGTKVCSNSIRIAGCELFKQDTRVEFAKDTLFVNFLDSWRQQLVFVSLYNDNGSVIYKDTLSHLEGSIYKKKIDGLSKGTYRFYATWRNLLLIRKVEKR